MLADPAVSISWYTFVRKTKGFLYDDKSEIELRLFSTQSGAQRANRIFLVIPKSDESKHCYIFPGTFSATCSHWAEQCVYLCFYFSINSVLSVCNMKYTKESFNIYDFDIGAQFGRQSSFKNGKRWWMAHSEIFYHQENFSAEHFTAEAAWMWKTLIRCVGNELHEVGLLGPHVTRTHGATITFTTDT